MEKPGPLAWAEKAVNEYRLGINPIVLLVRHDHTTEWYETLYLAGAHFLPIMERVQFLKPDGTPNGDSPNFQSTLAILA